MKNVVERLDQALSKTTGPITPAALKQALLGSTATAQVVETKAHESVEALTEVGQLVRQAAARLPAAGVALCMHNHVVLACARYPALFEESSSLVRAVGQSEALVASAFAEGIPGSDIFAPTLTVTAKGDGLVMKGSKKPCTLASIADYYIMSARHLSRDNTMALLLIPNRSDSIKVTPFWEADVLTECDSNEVHFQDLQLPHSALSPLSGEEVQGILAYGMATFNYFAANAYLGALDALQACIPARVASEPAVARVLTEQAVKINAILVQLASLAHDADRLEHAVPSILGLRYILEETLEDAAQFALRSCGGVEVVRSALPLRLFAAIQLFKFHPVSKFQFITAAMQAPQ